MTLDSRLSLVFDMQLSCKYAYAVGVLPDKLATELNFMGFNWV